MNNDWSLSYKKAVQAFPKLPVSTIRYMPYAIGLLGVLGFLDAAYLTILHYKNAIPPCTLSGCETVLTSQFATVAGIPISLIGAGYYLVVIVLVGILLSTQSDTNFVIARSETTKQSQRLPRSPWSLAMTPTLLVILTALGLLVGLGLVYIQAFILRSFCQYCLASEVIDFLLFDCAWWIWRKNTS